MKTQGSLTFHQSKYFSSFFIPFWVEARNLLREFFVSPVMLPNQLHFHLFCLKDDVSPSSQKEKEKSDKDVPRLKQLRYQFQNGK